MLEENKSNENELQRLSDEAQQSQSVNQIPDCSVEEDETDDKLVYGINPDIANKQLVCLTTEGYVGKASDYLEVINVIKNLDTQVVLITLRHLSTYCDNEVTVKMSDLKRTLIFNTLTSKGIVVFEWCVGALSHYLLEQIDELIKQGKIVFQHEGLGWSDSLDKSQGFFASNSIGTPYSSIMRGNDEFLLGSHGDRAIYDAMVQTEIIPNKSLHLPFVLAFTAPIVPLMYGKSACPVLMTNFAGKSSQGKTTSLALMASIWGRGIVDNNRLSVIKTFASTQNGFEAAVNSNNGVPVLFDDYEAASKSLSFGSLIYTLAQGESKIRCDKFGHAKETYQWRTTISLTGESSIFDRAGSNLGLRPRIVEFKNKSWTVSKSNSIAITSVVANNYGFLGEEFVSKLINLSQEELNQYYDDSSSAIESLLPSKDNISDRIQTRLVLIRMTAELVRKLLDLDIDVDYITKFLTDNELDRQSSLDIYEEAKEKLADYITTNLYRFIKTDEEFSTTLPNATIVGRIYNGSHGYVAVLTDDAFKAVMSSFNDKDAILEHWRDEGFLIPEIEKDSDGNIVKKRFKRKDRLCSHTPWSRYYTFVLEDPQKVLGNLLSENEGTVLQDLVDEEKEKRYQDSAVTPPKHTFYKGHRYVLESDVNKKAEQYKRSRRIPSKVTYSSPTINPTVPTETPISNLKFDDSDAVNEIFDGNKEDEND